LVEGPVGHIGNAELAKLLEESRLRPELPRDAGDLHPHLAVCLECRGRFEELALFDFQLKSMKPPVYVPRMGDCPEPDLWREIAGGLTPPEEMLGHIEHASRCNYCGALLRGAVAELNDLNGEISDADRRQIATLESARAEWQRRLAQRITGNSHRPLERVGRWRRWISVRLAIASGFLLLLVAAGFWLLVRRDQPAAAERLIARAYTEKRTLELRIAGADYAPLRVSLGPVTSFTNRPASLLKAESLIATQLESHPSDPSWLHAKAQADVLEGKYDAAAQSLRRALEIQPHSPLLLIDLATAYFERSQSDDRAEDLGAAFENLSQALKLQPDDPVALFNRAIVSEHQFLYRQALDDWDRYLRVDSASPWAEEARRRASGVRERLKERGGQATPLLSPTQMAAESTGESSTLRAEVDQRIEEYLHEAVRSWLPQAFPEAKVNGDLSAMRALFFLADLTARQHGDQWLDDLLGASSAPHFRQAVNALARAVQANDIDAVRISRHQSALAEKLFLASGNTAGVLRSRFEQSFEAQISRRSEECRRRSIAAAADSTHYSYPWLQIQLGLEESVCSALMGNLGANEKAASRAQDLAQRARYDALYLRALGFVSQSKFDTGNRSGGWKLVHAGLDSYWSLQVPVMRGYNLYTFGADAADNAGQPDLQLAMWQEAAATIDSTENLGLRAEAHDSIAKAATAAHRPEIAEREYAETARLSSLAPQDEASRNSRIESEVMTAQLEARQGSFDSALVRLTRLQAEIRRLSNSYLAQIFYSTLGEVQLRSHRAVEAEQAFQAALRLAEHDLASLDSEADRKTWSRDAASVYLGLAEAELNLGKEKDSLEIFEWYLGAPQRVDARGHNLSKATPDPTESLPQWSHLPTRPLLSDETVLAYGLLPDGLAIWVSDNRRVSAKWIPKSNQKLEELAADFYAECSEPNSEPGALRRDSRALYSLLVAPVEQWIDPTHTLVIETEGFLARLPFEALMDANGRYLVEREPIVYSPGPYAEARMHRAKAISREQPALVVGSEAFSPNNGLLAVPDNSSGANAVANRFRSARVLEGRAATLNAVAGALPGAVVFHFAGHSISTSNRTGLMLESRDSLSGDHLLLDATMLRTLNLQDMQLAVLAACDTDSGEGASRGLDSVAAAFQASGVPHVIASRWTVDSRGAKTFTDSFYGAVLSGQPVASATRSTAQKMLLNPLTAHPYYWAAFAADGRP
jgi:CHAT domain-containing protein/tetratricopeptide (TPR) repeat protein